MHKTQELERNIAKEQQKIIDETALYVQQTLGFDKAGHDWWHIYRVWKMAVYIATQEHADLFIVQLAALLHDIADWKFHAGDDRAGEHLTKEWLIKMNVEEKIISQVCSIINSTTFKGANVKNHVNTLEAKIVQDADRLDAIGAIGIARTFAYGGYKGILMHDPDLKPVMHNSFEEYKNHKGTTINHFYEKLLLLKDLMNTATAKALAEQRHAFMLDYLKQFFLEWDT